MAIWRTKTRDEEVLRMAQFKLGETARRLLALAEGATDPGVRANLIEVSATVLSQQCNLERESRTAKRVKDPPDVVDIWPPVRRTG